MTFEEKKKILIEYMKLKIEEADWHGVSDCANDLRELEILPIKQKKILVPQGWSILDEEVNGEKIIVMVETKK